MKYLYILYSPTTDRYYVGSTRDITRRLHEHDRGQTRSTRSGAPWTPCFVALHRDATLSEKHLKKMKNRQYLERIIQKQRIG